MAGYDDVAEWYDAWVRGVPGVILGQAAHLVPDLDGQCVLDAACGFGRVSREMARLGASVVGVDISQRLIATAVADEVADPLGVEFLHGDLAIPDGWWDGRPFDGAVCELALMDIADYDSALAGIGRVVRPGGWFVTSLVHPCFPGNGVGLSSWPPGRGYAAEGWWTSPEHNPDGVRLRLGASHRMLSSYVNTLADAGFTIERAFEPSADVPTILVLRCERRT